MKEGAQRTSRQTMSVRSVLKIFGGALLLALVLRGCVVEGFRIPTASMEKSLLVGDFVLVSKLHYGPRLPMSLGVPLTNWYVDDVALPYVRLPGFTRIRQGDAVVFNYPLGDAPVDRRGHYIKRVMGLPGDTVAIRSKRVFVNGEPVQEGEAVQQRWVAHTAPDAFVPFDSLRALGASQVARWGRHHDQLAFEATRAVARRVEALSAVTRVAPHVLARPDPTFGLRIFPRDSGFTRDVYGPLYVPARGDTLPLTRATWQTYKALIRKYEHQDTARLLPNGTVEIDGQPAPHYVVQQNYYFVMGDNRDSSVDSRVWGFVPEDHIVGKAVHVYFSLDGTRPRMDRVFKKVP